MKVFYINSDEERKDFDIPNIGLENPQLKNADIKAVFKKKLSVENPKPLVSNRQFIYKPNFMNLTAGSVGISHLTSNGNELYSENILVRTDQRAKCIDIELFIRIYYPKERYIPIKDFPFHNISLEEAQKGFKIGFIYNGEENITEFTSENINNMIKN